MRVLEEGESGRRGGNSGGGGVGGEAAQRGGNEVTREVTLNKKRVEEKLKLFRQRLQMENNRRNMALQKKIVVITNLGVGVNFQPSEVCQLLTYLSCGCNVLGAIQ